MIGVLFVALISYSLFASVGVRTNVDLIKASELMINKTQPNIDSINDATIKSSVNNVISSGKSNQKNLIEVNTFFVKNAWMFGLGIVAIVVFLLTRTLIEFNVFGNGGGIA